MSSETHGTSVVLSWRDVSELSVMTTGPRIPAEDGRIGVIGLRLLKIGASALEFEIEMDWLRYRLACQSFDVVSHPSA